MTTTLETSQDTLREKTLQAAQRHKASWIQLGQFLFTIHKEKLYRQWGFLSFETYCGKELRIKQTTAAKLLKSYSFLEREEPRLAQPALAEDEPSGTVPNFESVNLLRLAKETKKFTPHDVAEVRDSVLEKGKEAKEVRAQIKKISEKYDSRTSSEIENSKRNTTLKRMITVLANAKREFEKEKILPAYLLKQMGDLVEKLQDQIET